MSAPVTTHWALYNSLTRIPLTLTMGEQPAVPDWLYCRNHDEGHSLLEFYFDHPTLVLQEFVIVTLAGPLNQAVSHPLVYDPHAYYRCQLAEPDSPLTTLPLRLHTTVDHAILYYPEATQPLTYYQVGRNFSLGVTSRGHLAAIALTELTLEAQQAILGDVNKEV
ncbi:hypothetical protein [Hymenobacter terrestris]|uniref:Uncharacterized protein n=1 Tax=Hymenobacter terrestris TaxID=2748310 RepID=A0ABX2Q5D4_9BACT|nr:hypothetical protein [Hymenobacter terrestris]NVO86178.1 hypothetical protein [Hymenobacter terrestris]